MSYICSDFLFCESKDLCAHAVKHSLNFTMEYYDIVKHTYACSFKLQKTPCEICGKCFRVNDEDD